MVWQQTVRKNKQDSKDLALYVGNLTIAIWRPLQDEQSRQKVEEQAALLTQ